MKTRLQFEIRQEPERVPYVDDCAMFKGRNKFPSIGLWIVGLKTPIAVEEDCETANIRVGEVASAGILGQVRRGIVL